MYMANGAFAEYMAVSSLHALPVPSADPKFLPLLVSGLTASIALEQIGELKGGETVLVTAAAGGTGMFAVQLAKLKGCTVIGTCSSPEKVEFLKSIGCDRPINYKEEDLNTVLKKEFKQGVDCVYESVGGKMFETSVNRLANRGKVIVIGYISGYSSDKGLANTPGSNAALCAKLLNKSASVRGFLLFHYADVWRRHSRQLLDAVLAGKLRSFVSPERFHGLDSVNAAVDFLHSGKSFGKVVVDLEAASSKL